MNTKKHNQCRRVLKRYSAENREDFVEDFKKSGQMVSDFCHEKGINSTTFYGWLKKGSSQKPRFLEVSLPAAAPIAIKQVVEVKLTNGTILNIPANISIEYIVGLIRRLTEC